jgi:hypothetical protein
MRNNFIDVIWSFIMNSNEKIEQMWYTIKISRGEALTFLLKTRYLDFPDVLEHNLSKEDMIIVSLWYEYIRSHA